MVARSAVIYLFSGIVTKRSTAILLAAQSAPSSVQKVFSGERYAFVSSAVLILAA
jgi:hypothetical protein